MDNYYSAMRKINDGLLKKIGNDLVVRYAGELAKERLSSDKAKRLQVAIKVAQDVMVQIEKVASGAELTAEEFKKLKKGK